MKQRDQARAEGTETLPLFRSAAAAAAYETLYDRALAEWGIAWAQRAVPTPFGSTAVLQCGNPTGPDLVLLHWFCGNSSYWKDLARDLARDYRIHAIDVMGDLGRSRPTAAPRSEQDLAAWYGALLDGLGIDRAVLVGWSNGGFQASLIARVLPGRVSRLVLLAPAATVQSFSLRFYALVYRTALRPSDANLARFRDACCRWPERFPDSQLAMLAAAFRTGLIRVRIFPRRLKDRELAGLAMPVLLLVGEGDFIYRPAAAIARARRLLPDCRAMAVPGAGHALASDAPGFVAGALRDFLGGQAD